VKRKPLQQFWRVAHSRATRPHQQNEQTIMASQSSEYMLIFRDMSPETYAAMSPQQTEQCLADWNAWCDRLGAEGRMQHGHPLDSSGRVVSGAKGERVVDGPFLEAKECIGGYFLITADSLDEATRIAQDCPNLKNGMAVEVRPVVAACHLAHTLGRTTMRE
jgi:hypothetical protein